MGHKIVQKYKISPWTGATRAMAVIDWGDFIWAGRRHYL
jgi:hypothetical protein